MERTTSGLTDGFELQSCLEANHNGYEALIEESCKRQMRLI